MDRPMSSPLSKARGNEVDELLIEVLACMGAHILLDTSAERPQRLPDLWLRPAKARERMVHAYTVIQSPLPWWEYLG